MNTAKNWPDWRAQSELFEVALEEIIKLPPVSRRGLAFKTQHLLNQNELIKQSLTKYYRPNQEDVAQDILQQYDSLGQKLYFEQLNANIIEPTRLTQVPTSKFITKEKQQYKQKDLTEIQMSQTPRILGLSISNEHIEELWHPMIHKMGWSYKYICSRNKGYFRLYEESNLLNISDNDYIVNNWYSNPTELLYKTIEEFRPNVILLHNGNHPAYQQIIQIIQDKYGIPIIYSELGWFPQKQHLYFDEAGTNAKSNLAKMSFSDITGQLVIPPKKAST